MSNEYHEELTSALSHIKKVVPVKGGNLSIVGGGPKGVYVFSGDRTSFLRLGLLLLETANDSLLWQSAMPEIVDANDIFVNPSKVNNLVLELKNTKQ